MSPADETLHRRIWAIAGPAILANISGPMVGVVDTWALGHLPDPRFLAAIAVGSFVFHFVYWSFGFLRMGTTGMAAQAHGAADDLRLTRIVLRAAALGLGFALIVLALQGPLLAALFALLKPAAAAADLAMQYCLIRIWSAPAILLRITVIGFLIGTQRAKTALVIEVALNLLNAALTVWFVAGLDWGIVGAARASVIAEALAAMLALGVALRLLRPAALLAAAREAGFWRPAAFGALLSVNGYLFLRTLLLLAAFGLLWRVSAGLGTLTLSANQVLMQFLMLTSFGLDGIAYAAEALVGAAKGRARRSELHRVVRLTTLWAGLMALGYTAVFALAGETMIAGFTDLAEVRAAAGAHLLWLVAMPVLAVWSYQFDGVFIGATETRAMLLTMIAAFALYAAAVALLAPRFGNDGLWAAMALFLLARGGGLALLYPALARRVGAES